MGAYVSLLEYGNIEGMILLSELSRRRIRSVQKLIKVGRTGWGWVTVAGAHCGGQADAAAKGQQVRSSKHRRGSRLALLHPWQHHGSVHMSPLAHMCVLRR